MDESFVLLSHPFRVRTDSAGCAELVQRVFGACRHHPGLGEAEAVFEITESAPGAASGAMLTRNGDTVIRNAKPSDAFALMVWQIMNQAVSNVRDLLIIHAGAVVAPSGRAIVFPAGSGSGKTTLVAGLVQAGFGFLSDETAVIDPATRRILAVPRALSIKPGTFEALGVDAPVLSEAAQRFFDGTWPVPADYLRPDAMGHEAECAMVIAPAYSAGAETWLEPISRAAGLADLATNAFNLEGFGGGAGVMLLGDVVRGATCYRLQIGSLNDAVDAIRSALAD